MIGYREIAGINI